MWRKLAKSERFNVSKCFETKLKQPLEKVKIPEPISGVSKHLISGWYREIIETDWNMKKIGSVRKFQLFRNVSKQNWNKLWKRCKNQAPFLVFRIIETVYYKGKLWNGLKHEENWLSLKVSVVLKHLKTKLKQALEKVKIPGSISGVSKHWNNRLYRKIIETDWNMKKIDLSPYVLKRFETFRNKI